MIPVIGEGTHLRIIKSYPGGGRQSPAIDCAAVIGSVARRDGKGLILKTGVRNQGGGNDLKIVEQDDAELPALWSS